MGIDKKCNSLQEFDIEENNCEKVHHHFSNKMESYASSVYNGNKLILSGGSNQTYCDKVL